MAGRAGSHARASAIPHRIDSRIIVKPSPFDVARARSGVRDKDAEVTVDDFDQTSAGIVIGVGIFGEDVVVVDVVAIDGVGTGLDSGFGSGVAELLEGSFVGSGFGPRDTFFKLSEAGVTCPPIVGPV